MIYAIQAKGTAFIKIGFTERDIRRRLDTLQTGCPFDLELLAIGAGNRVWEQLIHLDLKKAKKHHFREWFLDSTEVRRWVAWIESNNKDLTHVPELAKRAGRLGRLLEYAKQLDIENIPVRPLGHRELRKQRKEERAKALAIPRARARKPRCTAAPDLGDWWQSRAAAQLCDSKAPQQAPIISVSNVDSSGSERPINEL